MPGSSKDTVSHTITGLVAGTEYTFQIAAGDLVLVPESDEATATPS